MLDDVSWGYLFKCYVVVELLDAELRDAELDV